MSCEQCWRASSHAPIQWCQSINPHCCLQLTYMCGPAAGTDSACSDSSCYHQQGSSTAAAAAGVAVVLPPMCVVAAGGCCCCCCCCCAGSWTAVMAVAAVAGAVAVAEARASPAAAAAGGMPTRHSARGKREGAGTQGALIVYLAGPCECLWVSMHALHIHTQLPLPLTCHASVLNKPLTGCRCGVSAQSTQQGQHLGVEQLLCWRAAEQQRQAYSTTPVVFGCGCSCASCSKSSRHTWWAPTAHTLETK